MIGKSDRNMKYTLIVPVVAFILIVAIFPLIFSIYMMLSIWAPGTGGIKFVGLQNLKAISRDMRFWHALWLSYAYVAILLTLELGLGTMIAMVLQKEIKGKNFFRVSYMLPMLLSPVAPIQPLAVVGRAALIAAPSYEPAAMIASKTR